MAGDGAKPDVSRHASQNGKRGFADFSGSDVRGADFTGADLRSANFNDATMDVPPSRGVLLLGTAILVTVGAGAAIGWSLRNTTTRLTSGELDEIVEGATLAFVLVLLVGVLVWRGFDVAIRVAGVTYLVLVAVSLVFISKRAIRGDQRDRTLRTIAHWIVRRWGTRFVDADLTGADFTGADPRGCDFRGAIVEDVTWDPSLPLPLGIPDSTRPP